MIVRRIEQGGQLPLEMSMGHVLQNLVKLYSEHEVHTATLYQLRVDVDCYSNCYWANTLS